MLKLKKNKGITLIALVITIIVLLILAAITIGQIQNSGLFNKTQVAKETYTLEAEQEQLELEIANLKMQMYANNTEKSTTLDDLKTYLESEKFNGEYLVELFYEPLAATSPTSTTPLYAKVTHIPTQFVFIVDGKLVVIGGESSKTIANSGNVVSGRGDKSKLINDFNIKTVARAGTVVTVNLDGNISTTDGSNVIGYVIAVDGVGIGTTEQLPYNVELARNETHNIDIYAIDKEINMKKSTNTIEATIPNVIMVPLEYPILMTTGMINVKYVDPDDSSLFTYALEPTIDCTGTNALKKEAYDGDPTTYVNAGASTRFVFGNDSYYTGYWCILSESGPAYQSWKGDSWAGGSGEFSKYDNGYYWYSYYKYPGHLYPTSSNGLTITGGGKIYEVTSIVR